MGIFEQIRERYQSGAVPWDAVSPPPEVAELVDVLAPGRALDLGCGYGRASILLAKHGWLIDAVDFVPEAVGEAARRAEEAGVASRIRFHLASITDLSFLESAYDFALDVGCMHVLSGEELIAYRDELLRLLRPGAVYLLFARLTPDEENDEENVPGIRDKVARRMFADGFVLDRVEYGETQIQDDAPWLSAWYWFHRV